MNVSEMMTTDVLTCGLDDSIVEVSQRMAAKNVGSCPVLEHGNMVGIVTDRDFITRAIARGYNPNITRVHEVMTRNVVSGNPSMTAEEAARLMADHQIRRLPIMENGKLVGIVSLADLAIDLDEDDVVAETLMKISEPSHWG